MLFHAGSIKQIMLPVTERTQVWKQSVKYQSSMLTLTI